MELVKIKASDYGLEESKAKQISDMFKPMLDKMVELENDYNTIISKDISPDLCKEAKDLRLKYVKIRTGTASIHKELKQFYLQGGRFVDGWKNAQLMASQGIEDKLSAIENHYENIEKERIARIQEQRAKELSPYEIDPIPTNLGDMKEEVWINFLAGVKHSYEERKKAEKLALEKEKEEAAEKDRLRAEVESLKKAEEERQQKEIDAQKKKEAQIQAELNKGDEDKVKDLISDIQDLKMKYLFKSDNNKKMFENVRGLLDKVITYIEINT